MSCEICDYISGKIKTKKLYEDADILAVFNPKPAAFGHAIIIPKKHFTLLPQVPDETIKRMFVVAQQIAGIIFEAVGAEGTNIMISEGVAAGQKHAHTMIHVIPRKKDDGMGFEWPQKQVPEDSMGKIHELLKIPEKAAEMPAEAEKIEKPKKEEAKNRVKDYLLRHWTGRIPR